MIFREIFTLQESSQIPFSHFELQHPATLVQHLLAKDSAQLKKFGALPSLCGFEVNDTLRRLLMQAAHNGIL